MVSADFFKALALKTSYVKFIILPLVLLYLLPEITDEFWTSVSIATLSSRQALLYGSYSLVLTFVLGFFHPARADYLTIDTLALTNGPPQNKP